MVENLADLAEHALQRLGERRSLNFEGRWITNVQSMERARRLHSAFAELGVSKGDVVALCMLNHPTVYPIFQGAFRTGAAALPVMFQLSAPELRFILNDAQVAGVVTDSFNLAKVLEACQGLESVRWVAVLEGDEEADSEEGRVSSSHQPISLQSLLEAPPTTELPRIEGDDLAMLLYTSGTTGKPKGAMLSHRNLISSAEQAQEASELHLIEAPRRVLSAMPMAHIFGVGVMNGGYLVPERLADGYMVQHVWFEPERFMAGIQEHRCQSIPAVPTMLSLMLNHPKVGDYDLSSLEEVVCGAAPLPVEVAKTFMDRYQCRVREIYGMTESAGMATANRCSEDYRPGSAGRPYSRTEVRIVAADDDSPPGDSSEALPAGQRGEVVLRGDSVMLGYLNRPEATKETVINGWLYTGDIGYLEDDGFLYIVDRKKDMIIRGGENIYPAEIEAVLYQHDCVAEAAVVGVPDDVYGESVVAYVVPMRETEIDTADIRAYLAEHLMKFKVPSKVHLLEALPKSGVGKILRRELREMAAGNCVSDGQSAVSTTRS